MTREEAIKVIHKMLAYTDLSVRANLNSDMVDACHMAIKALEQEPTTNSETLVSLDVYNQVAKERNIAIEQLHQLGYEFGQKIEPTAKNDLAVDCISRADAIKGLGEQPYVWTDGDFEIQQLADWKTHKEMLENLPSVTPQEPRKGHWIDDKCSVCGKGIEDLIDSREWYRNEKPNFCPFCGTKMVEPQESEEEKWIKEQ